MNYFDISGIQMGLAHGNLLSPLEVTSSVNTYSMLVYHIGKGKILKT